MSDSNKLKDPKATPTSITPDGSVRLGTKPNSLHQRVANAVANPQVGGLPTGFKLPPGYANFGKIMFFADCSGSMDGNDDYHNPQAEAKIESMKKAFDSYLNNCNPLVNHIGIASFPEQAYESPTPDYNMMRSIIKQLEATGGTPLAAAMNYVLENESVTHAVIISDGDADDPTLAKDIAGKFARKLVKIDTVHIGSSTGGEQLLKEIAEATGGIYVKFTDTLNFAKTFQYLSPAKRGLLTSSKNPVALLGAAEVKI